MLKNDPSGHLNVRDKHIFTWNKIVGHKDCPAWRRWVIPLPFGFSIRYHDFTPGHVDTDAHSHPWWFVTLVISGSYTDIGLFDPLPEYNGFSVDFMSVKRDKIKRGRMRFRPRNHVHKVKISDEGCKTILFTGRHHKAWGFYTPEGYLPAAVYRESKWAETICDR